MTDDFNKDVVRAWSFHAIIHSVRAAFRPHQSELDFLAQMQSAKPDDITLAQRWKAHPLTVRETVSVCGAPLTYLFALGGGVWAGIAELRMRSRRK